MPREQAECSGEGYSTLVCHGVAMRMPLSCKGPWLGRGHRGARGDLDVVLISCDMDVHEGVIAISHLISLQGTYTELKKAAMAGPDQRVGHLDIAACGGLACDECLVLNLWCCG